MIQNLVIESEMLQKYENKWGDVFGTYVKFLGDPPFYSHLYFLYLGFGGGGWVGCYHMV